jgi:hypothetical protein
LAKWGPETVKENVERLVNKKLVARINYDRERIIPGRNYRMSDRYLTHLDISYGIGGD